MNEHEKRHQMIVERIEYLADNHEEMEIDDKISQLKMIFEGMQQQQDLDLLAEEIYILACYSFTDKAAVLHVNIKYLQEKQDV